MLDSELQAGSLQIAALLTLVGTVVLAVTSAIAWFVLRRMFRPARQARRRHRAVAGGELDIKIDG